ncbi:MAG: acyl-CoA dehydrogenase family protein [bacterium]
MAFEFEMTDEQKMIRDTVKGMVKKIEPRREEFRRMVMDEKKFPQELWDMFADAGFLGALVPEEYGGTDMGLMAMAMALEEMGCHGFGNAFFILTTMATMCTLKNGTEEQKRRFLPRIVRGDMKIAFALTEPDAGSNTFRISTLAKKDGGAYRVTGQKVFITGADVADAMLLVTRTTSVDECIKQGMPKAYGFSLFIAPTKAKGLEMKPIPTRGIEGMRQFTLYMEDMEVSADDLIGQENMGSMALFNSLNPERILAAANTVGLSEHVIQKACEYARERRVFGGKPIGSHQAIQHPLAECKIEQEAVRLLVYKAATMFDADAHPGQVGIYANMAKYLAAELGIKAVDRAMETLGGYGFSEEYGIIYYHDVVRLLKTAPISKEMILNFVGEHVLNLPRSY